MKRLVILFISLALVLSACALAEDAGSLTVGELAKCGISAEELNSQNDERFDGVETEQGVMKPKVEYFDGLNEMLMALNAGRIDNISMLPDCVAQYIIKRNPDLRYVDTPDTAAPVRVMLCMALDTSNQPLLDTLNSAIAAMTEDGTIDELRKTYIDALAANAEPVPAEIAKIEGAETLRVVVTGDLPPLDYVSADGVPAGFNVAFLSKLSERIGMNIELVTSNAASRSLQLASGKADVIFWMRDISFGESIDSEANGALLTTQPYFIDGAVNVEKAD